MDIEKANSNFLSHKSFQEHDENYGSVREGKTHPELEKERS